MHSGTHWQTRLSGALCLALLAASIACGAAEPVRAGEACRAEVNALAPVALRKSVLRGITPVDWVVPVVVGHTYVVELALEGNDALLEVEDARHTVIARADHPERRSGTRRAIVQAGDEGPVTVRVTGKEHAEVVGTARLRVADIAELRADSTCRNALRMLAAADSDYASGQDVSRGREGAHPLSARHAFLRAAEGYMATYAALDGPGDERLRGEAALAVAGVEYFDLQNWALAADWASRASAELAQRDPYLQARADAVLAAAWIELANQAGPGQRVPNLGIDPAELRARARRMLERLARFHVARHEPYDAALQVNNVGLTLLYAGQFSECAAISRTAERMFGALRESPRQGLAAQNRGMCLWGLGHLTQALDALTEALTHLRPDPYPSLYLMTLENAALLHYARGEFDASLALQGEALALARRVQSKRAEAHSLFGIGETYYALGDLPRAREFLEQSLAIRTVAFDGRGRLAVLRALATVDADEGRAENALARDREALALATVPASAAGIRLQMAAHTLATGRTVEATRILDDEIAAGAGSDPLVVGRALLERAIVRRRGGDLDGALKDLAAARPLLHDWGTVGDSFVADLETARTDQARGATVEALAAVDRAVARASAIRLQTANPELRTGLQAPLRDAYALKLDLLWDLREAAVRHGNTGYAEQLAADAFNAADTSRAHAFADVAAAQYPVSLRHALAAQFARREVLYRDIAERRFTLEAHQDAVASSDTRATELRAEIAGLEHSLDAVNNAIASRATAKRGSPGNIRQSGQTPLVPGNTVLIAYWLGPEQAYAWVVGRTGIHWVRLGPSDVIATGARLFHEALARAVDVPVSRRLALGADLYARILRPLEGWIRNERSWLIIPDAAVNYVPFAALRASDTTGEYFVVARHDVALVPAAWMLRPESTRRVDPNRRLLLVADPVYERTDPRLARVADAHRPGVGASAAATAGPELYRLPFTGREAAAIAAEFPPESVEQLEGVEASRDRVLALDWSRYGYIHFATHGIADATHPQFSSLLLSRYDGSRRPIESAIRVADLELLTLTSDVVVFSACETAFGKNVLSEGLLGLGYTTLARGSRSVVASLWPVADEMSAALMTEFYRYLLGGSMRAESALSAAMRAVLVRDPLADPALWAPFQVSITTVAPTSGANRISTAGHTARH